MHNKEKPEYKGTERRRYQRIPFSFPVRYIFCGFDINKLKEEGQTQYTHSNNIGLGGIQVKMQKKPKLGQCLKMKLTLPVFQDHQIMHLLGQVAWSDFDDAEQHFIVGIAFIDMDDIQKIKLEEFIKEALDDIK